jgi:hypothetical protein
VATHLPPDLVRSIMEISGAAPAHLMKMTTTRTGSDLLSLLYA